MPAGEAAAPRPAAAVPYGGDGRLAARQLELQAYD